MDDSALDAKRNKEWKWLTWSTPLEPHTQGDIIDLQEKHFVAYGFPRMPPKDSITLQGRYAYVINEKGEVHYTKMEHTKYEAKSAAPQDYRAAFVDDGSKDTVFNNPLADGQEGFDGNIWYKLKSETRPYDRDELNSLLHRAAKNKDCAEAERLLRMGADVDAEIEGNTPLVWAAWRGHKDVAQLLIEKGADVNATGQDITPLGCAALGGHRDVAEFLIARGADVGAKDASGRTLLHCAAAGGKDVTELFIAKGVDVNARDRNGCTPLHSAARYGRRKAAEVLIANGADVNVKDEDGETPLDYAKTDEMKALLRKHGAKTWQEVR